MWDESRRRGPEPEQIDLKPETCHLLQELLVEGDLLEVRHNFDSSSLTSKEHSGEKKENISSHIYAYQSWQYLR